MSGLLYVMKIEIDGHFHGSADVPKPWVAQIGAPCPRYGLERTFVQTMNDWSEARRAWSGNVYGRVAHFPLRDGNLYEVSRLRGTSSSRHVAREFVVIEHGKRVALTPEEALARADGGRQAAPLRIPEDTERTSWVAEIAGLGTPRQLGFVVVDGSRRYRLRAGLHEIVQRGTRRFASSDGRDIKALSETEAFAWLLQGREKDDGQISA